ncbi:MAG: helix-turn-helix domain-containing protein [Christensenellaceae bacterium]
MDSVQVSNSDKRTYTVEEIAVILNIGKTAAYDLVKSGCFHIVKIGKAIRISKKSFDLWLDQDA